MAALKKGQIDITPRKKEYVTLWRPDGQPIDVNVTNKIPGYKRVEELMFHKKYTKTKPQKAIDREKKQAAEAKAKAEAKKEDK